MKHEEIRICDVSVYSGRNIYSHRPVVKMTVDIGKYGCIPTNQIPGFHEQLLRLLPGLRTNCCSLGYPGGFLERLESGTYLAHVLEHVILEMQSMVGYDVCYGKTRTLAEPSLYYLVYEYRNEVCGVECGKSGVVLLNHLLSGREIAFRENLLYLKKVSQEAELGPSTEAIVNEAKKRGIPATRIGTGSLVRLGYGRHSRLAESTLTDTTSCISADISCNKQLTKYLLSEHKIPVPYGKVVYSELSAQMAALQIGMPVAVKPFDGNQGKGVHLNLTTGREVREAFRDASQFSSGIIVEQYIEGLDFRVLVVGSQVRAVAQRLPARVTGDGVHTVRQLVTLVNRDPNRGNSHEKPLTKIRLDEIALQLLRKNGLSPDSVIPEGMTVFLRENGNISTGGTAVDCTDLIHPDNADLAVRAARAVGIDIAGIDIVAPDISRPITETKGVVVEVNTAPGIRMHLYPSEGKPRNVAKDVMDLLFPDDASARFPIVSVTGTNGKTTVARLVQHVLMKTGLQVGLTSTSGTFINDRCICRGDNSGPRSAKSLLSDKSIDAAVLETARGGLLREGLGYDLADVGIITNVSEDHLGSDGVETLEDLAYIKGLVVEAVKKDGAAVLNAEDPSTPLILERVKVRPVLFGKNEKIFRRFAPLNPICVFTRNDWLQIRDNTRAVRVVRTGDIPITAGGLIPCNVENALAAAAALYALKVPLKTIAAGLADFTDNPGRFQLFRLDDVQIMLDYGHNSAGYDQALHVCQALVHKRLVGIVGMPGDRMDSAIREVGARCAAAFDRIYLKEDADLRGREKGEVAGLLYEAAVSRRFPQERLTVLEGEKDALERALADALPGDLIVVFYEKLEPLRGLLLEKGAGETALPDAAWKDSAASNLPQTMV